MKIFYAPLLLAVIFIMCILPANAQQVTPPSRVSVKFTAKYPQYANKASWQQTSEGYTATFKENGNSTVSRYSENGQWLGTQSQLREEDWQPTMRQYLNDNHKGYRYLQGYRFENAKGIRYQLDVQSPNGNRYRLDFDGEGSFVREGPIQ